MPTTTISLRVSHTLLDRIDAAAERAGVTRNTYVLSWLPVNYDHDLPNDARNTQTAGTA